MKEKYVKCKIAISPQIVIFPKIVNKLKMKNHTSANRHFARKKNISGNRRLVKNGVPNRTWLQEDATDLPKLAEELGSHGHVVTGGDGTQVDDPGFLLLLRHCVLFSTALADLRMCRGASRGRGRVLQLLFAFLLQGVAIVVVFTTLAFQSQLIDSHPAK